MKLLSGSVEAWCWANECSYDEYVQKLEDENFNDIYGRYLDKQAYDEFVELMTRYYERSN